MPTKRRPRSPAKLAWVGMNEIEMPVRIEDDAGGLIQSTALVTAYVNLIDPDVRGIHMSRLYLHLDQGFGERPLNPCTLRQLLRSFLDSHEGLSDRALIRVDFDYVTRRPALESDNVGWRRYPVSMIGILEGQRIQPGNGPGNPVLQHLSLFGRAGAPVDPGEIPPGL